MNEFREGVELSALSIGTFKLIKSLMSIIVNFSANPAIQTQCLDAGLMSLIMEFLKLKDYELQTNTFTVIGNFMTSDQAEIRKRVVRSDFLQLMIDQIENSRFYRIKRICGDYLTRTMEIDPSLFELNDLIMQSKIRPTHFNQDLSITHI